MSRHATSTRTASCALADDGVALVMTMMLTGLLTALGLALTMLATVETWLSAGLRTSQELTYAADAALTRVQVDLTASSDWTVLAGAGTTIASTFDDGRASVSLADGTVVDLVKETQALQIESDRRCGLSASDPTCPEWRLFAHAWVDTLVPGRIASSPLYVAAWIADDPSDGDPDPQTDRNGRLLVRAQAFGPRASRRSIEAILGRAPAGTRIVAWKELR
jgi:hypothetical protein